MVHRTPCQLRRQPGRQPRRAPNRPRGTLFTPLTIVAPLAAFAAVFVWDGAPPGRAAALAPTDRESASFARCIGPLRQTCVVDGDTFWYRGTKIRVADINTPETGTPACAAEAELGAAATRRMTQLLNAGPFSLAPGDPQRDTDRYGRALRVVTRGGDSLGAVLVAEGLAEAWSGRRSSWC